MQFKKSCFPSTMNHLTFNPSIYFNHYDWYEEYDENMSYNTDYFEYDYGFGNRKYLNNLFNISFDDNSEKKYVVAEEILDENSNEFKFLLENCQCKSCKSSKYDLSKQLVCLHCIGCFKSGYPSSSVIKETRDFLLKYNKDQRSMIKKQRDKFEYNYIFPYIGFILLFLLLLLMFYNIPFEFKIVLFVMYCFSYIINN